MVAGIKEGKIEFYIEDEELALWLSGTPYEDAKVKVLGEREELSKSLDRELIVYEPSGYDYKIEYKGHIFDAYYDYGTDDVLIPFEYNIDVLKHYIPQLRYVEYNYICDPDSDLMGTRKDVKKWFLVYNDLTEEFGIICLNYKKYEASFAVDYIWKFPKDLYEKMVKGQVYMKRPFKLIIAPEDLYHLAEGWISIHELEPVLVIRLEKHNRELFIIRRKKDIVTEEGKEYEYQIWEIKKVASCD